MDLSGVYALFIDHVQKSLEGELVSQYGQQIAGLLILCTITVFRREISCNGEYKSHVDDDDQAPSVVRSTSSLSDDSSMSAQFDDFFSNYAVLSEKEADKLLEQTGFLCCPGPYIAVLMAIYTHWVTSKCMEEEDASTASLQVKFWRVVKFLLLRDSVYDEEHLDEFLQRGKPEDVLFVPTDIAGSMLAKDTNNNIGHEQYCVEAPLDQFMMGFVSNCYPNKQSCVCEDLNQCHETCESSLFLTCTIPSDVQIQILSYLVIKDVVSFGGVSCSTRSLVDDGITSFLLWKELMLRDYYYILCEWELAQEAYRRSISVLTKKRNALRTSCSAFENLISIYRNSSSSAQSLSMKEVYFMFSDCWVDYCIAGQNTMERCLVGLHGDVYDISDFIEHHPGSPETLLMHAGRDASKYFEELGHSLTARTTAQSFLVASGGDWIKQSPRIPKVRSKRGRVGTLLRIRKRFDNNYQQQQKLAVRWQSRNPSAGGGIVGDVNVFFDIFQNKWRFWFTGMVDLQPVYKDSLVR